MCPSATSFPLTRACWLGWAFPSFTVDRASRCGSATLVSRRLLLLPAARQVPVPTRPPRQPPAAPAPVQCLRPVHRLLQSRRQWAHPRGARVACHCAFVTRRRSPQSPQAQVAQVQVQVQVLVLAQAQAPARVPVPVLAQAQALARNEPSVQVHQVPTVRPVLVLFSSSLVCGLSCDSHVCVCVFCFFACVCFLCVLGYSCAHGVRAPAWLCVAQCLLCAGVFSDTVHLTPVIVVAAPSPRLGSRRSDMTRTPKGCVMPSKMGQRRPCAGCVARVPWLGSSTSSSCCAFLLLCFVACLVLCV